jgi:hypothetical protein
MIHTLERLRELSAERGHPMLASMLAMTKAEAEDELRTTGAHDRMLNAFREGSTVNAWRRPDAGA